MSDRSGKTVNEMSVEELRDLSGKSELAMANFFSIIALTVLSVFISATYVIIMIAGLVPVSVGLITILLIVAPCVLAWIFYMNDRKSSYVKMTIGAGFSLVYTYILFTSDTEMVFLYVVPILIIVALYSDVRFTLVFSVVTAVVNLIYMIVRFATGNVTDPDTVTTLPMRVVLMFFISAALVMVSFGTKKFENIRMSRLLLEESKIKGLLDDTLRVSGKMTETVTGMTGEMETLKDSVDQTLTSMEEVNGGTAESAEAIQNQLIKTEEIQNHIEDVEKASREIGDNVLSTTRAIEAGQKHIVMMDELTDQVDRAGKDVADALKKFHETASQMNSITELINNVADQTSLLALNASIEAARAGAAGRGFGVVATEISNLAGQTTNATGDINRLIGEVTGQLGYMTKTIEYLLERGEEESRCAGETAESFKQISASVEEIMTRSEHMEIVVGNLSKANAEIVNSIQTISAITEEVTAHASTTYSISEQNQKIVDNINSMVGELNLSADELRGYSN